MDNCNKEVSSKWMFDRQRNYPNSPNYFSTKDEELIIDPVSENVLNPIIL